MINLLLVDHNRLFAEGLQTAIDGKKEGFSVCNIAWDAREAIRSLRDLRPSIIIFCVRDSRQATLSAIKALALQSSRVPLVLLSSLENMSLVVEGLRCGIRGYLRMNLSLNQLLISLKAVASGTLVLDPQVVPEILNDPDVAVQQGMHFNARRLSADEVSKTLTSKSALRFESSHIDQAALEVPQWYDELTRKERQILWCVVQDFQNEDIGEHLHLASQTVRNYISRIYCKLNVKTRAQAIRLARESMLF